MALFSMDVEDMPEFKPVPSGDYEAVITKAELGESRSKKPMLILTVKLQDSDPEVNGVVRKFYNMIPEKNSEHYDLQLKSTRAMCEALGISGNPELEDFESVECRVKIVAGEYDGKPTDNIDRFLPME